MIFGNRDKENAPPPQPGLGKVKNIIAVGSGKGGVGKSTVAANLAVALAGLGRKAGLLDADIYGPTQPGLLGAGADRLDLDQPVLKPLSRHGVSFMSIALLMPHDGPVIWRAPMAVKAIHQFLNAVAWGDLDHLLIDMPPGTGDVQLTLAQQAALTGSVIVTTPQDVALGIARKGLKMFQEVKVPILGVVENMSGYLCQACGARNAVFKEGGGERLAREFGIPFLGAVPLDAAVVESGDSGVPVAAQAQGSPSGRAFLAIARALEQSAEKSRGPAQTQTPERVQTMPTGELLILWPDKHESVYTPYGLRLACSCAGCVDEDTGTRTLDPAKVPPSIKALRVEPVGRYGLAVHFSDGHNTGIYTFDRLRTLCECLRCRQAAPNPR